MPTVNIKRRFWTRAAGYLTSDELSHDLGALNIRRQLLMWLKKVYPDAANRRIAKPKRKGSQGTAWNVLRIESKALSRAACGSASSRSAPVMNRADIVGFSSVWDSFYCIVDCDCV